MSLNDDVSNNIQPPFDDNIEVYRAVLKGIWFDKTSRRILSGAFVRKIRDISGLSVYLAERRTVESICKQFDLKAVGCLTLKSIRSIPSETQLDVVQTSRDHLDHANIRGLPAYGKDGILAEELASQLANCCAIVYPEL